MNKRNRSANFEVNRVFIDIVFIALSYLCSTEIYYLARGIVIDSQHIWFPVVFAVVYISSMMWFSMYNVTTFCYIDRIIRRTLLSTFIASGCISAVIFFTEHNTASRLFFAIFAAMSFTLLLGVRIIYRLMRKYHIGNGYTHVLFMGNRNVYNKYLEYIHKTSKKIKVDCFIDLSKEEITDEVELEDLIKSYRIDEVVLVQDIAKRSKYKLKPLLAVCESMGITSNVLLDSYELDTSDHYVSSIGTIPMITYHNKSLDNVQLFLKMILDTIGAVIGLILASPILIITAIAIKVESKGPVFFKQVRVGRNGKKFTMYKFRSMYTDAEERKAELMAQNKIQGGLMFKMDNDPRITRVGKFIRKTSIDELPQLLNVIKRDMSLVGTRPPTVDEVSKYDRHHHRRISIVPGITGMWQVSGRSDIIDFEEVIALDNKYIENWSLWLDIKLIFKTVFVMFSRKGAV